MLAVVAPAAAAAPATEPTTAPAPRDTRPFTWSATDALSRSLPGHAECGPPREGRFVGVFYFLWMDERPPGLRVHDISRLLTADPKNPAWGRPGAFHWWAMPHLGYYTSTDAFVIRRHGQVLADAGVDVVVFDVTNGLTYEPAYLAVCRVFRRMRAEGNRTPQVAFLCNARHDQVVRRLYDGFYAKGLYPELWFRWKGKPLIMSDAAGMPDDVRGFFTFRRSWAWTDPKGWFGDGRDKWPWLDHTPQRPGWHDQADRPEQICVCVAEHPTSNIGRSFQGGRQPPPGRERPAEGLYFAEQWRRALEVGPEFVFVTGWNEWIAQRFVKRDDQPPGHFMGRKLSPGDTYFVDLYSQEFSRDIEPMAGGHGDNYYYQMAANIRRYKGVPAAEKASAAKTIGVEGGFEQWNDVRPAYLDDLHDTTRRNHPGYGDAGVYTNATGRNDFDCVKVARDATYVYFYARTRAPVTPAAGDNWMVLLLDTDTNPKTGWNGYDVMINRSRLTAGTCRVERNVDGGWKWDKLGDARVSVKGNEMHVAVPRKLIGLDPAKGPLAVDFKWADNVPAPAEGPNPLDFIDKGDVAPNGRFNYRYRE